MVRGVFTTARFQQLNASSVIVSLSDRRLSPVYVMPVSLIQRRSDSLQTVFSLSLESLHKSLASNIGEYQNCAVSSPFFQPCLGVYVTRLSDSGTS